MDVETNCGELIIPAFEVHETSEGWHVFDVRRNHTVDRKRDLPHGRVQNRIPSDN